jgi:nickel-dependent lactate racemase
MELNYGTTSFRCELPADKVIAAIQAASPLAEVNPQEIILAALDSCREAYAGFRSGEKVLIVTSDITRYTGSEIYLPLLVERLNAAGIRDRDIEVLVALGIHRRQTPHEHEKIMGSLYGRIRVSDHDCDDPGKLALLGRTSGGVDVEVNRKVVEADRVILTGTIGFHYFAGFGGGRKSILPGVASRKSCMASHFAVLNPGEGSGRNPRAATGVLEGNPVHQAMVEGCAMAHPDFILNTVLSPNKRIIAAFAGDWRAAHLAGCGYYAERFAYPVDRLADLVVVSCGGFPKDINFIQAHKAMEYGSRALRDGGVMVLLAECRDGYGNATFFDWFRFRDPALFEAELRRNYEINGQTAYSAMLKAQRFRVILVSALPAAEVKTMGMLPATTLDGALELAEGMLPKDYQAYVIPQGGTVLPVLTSGTRL